MEKLYYRGFYAKLTPDPEVGLVGEVENTNDSLSFHGKNGEEVKVAFERCIDDYVNFRCPVEPEEGRMTWAEIKRKFPAQCVVLSDVRYYEGAVVSGCPKSNFERIEKNAIVVYTYATDVPLIGLEGTKEVVFSETDVKSTLALMNAFSKMDNEPIQCNSELENKMIIGTVLGRSLTEKQFDALKQDWKAFYREPEKYRETPVVEMVKQYLEEMS